MATNRVSRKAMRRAGLSNVGERQPVDEYLQEVWEKREFAVAVPLGQLRAQHMNTLLGNLWHVLNPLLLMGIYYVLFGVILHTSRGIPHYLAFLAIGVFIFNYTQRSVSAGAGTIFVNEGLIRAIYFPRSVLPISTVIGETIAFAPAVGVMLFISIINGVIPGPTWVLLVPLIAVQALFNLGAAFIVARVGDAYRDFTQILPHFFRILIYMSGAMYSVQSFIHSTFVRHLFELNPMYSFISLARACILGTGTTYGMYISVFGWTASLLIGGFIYFRAAEHTYGRG